MSVIEPGRTHHDPPDDTPYCQNCADQGRTCLQCGEIPYHSCTCSLEHRKWVPCRDCNPDDVCQDCGDERLLCVACGQPPSECDHDTECDVLGNHPCKECQT